MIRENSEKGSEEPQNRRQQYKKEKLEESNQIYVCECGKNYLTFSALYLHARNKHNIKLTTKRNPQNSKTQIKDSKTYITYFTLHESTSLLPQNSSQKNQFQNQSLPFKQPEALQHQAIILAYLNQEKDKISEEQAAILGHFLRYFEVVTKEKVRDHYDPSSDITFYFNQFSVFYYPREVSRSPFRNAYHAYVEHSLMNFYNWLKNHKLTKYEVIYTPPRQTYPFF